MPVSIVLIPFAGAGIIHPHILFSAMGIHQGGIIIQPLQICSRCRPGDVDTLPGKTCIAGHQYIGLAIFQSCGIHMQRVAVVLHLSSNLQNSILR